MSFFDEEIKVKLEPEEDDPFALPAPRVEKYDEDDEEDDEDSMSMIFESDTNSRSDFWDDDEEEARITGTMPLALVPVDKEKVKAPKIGPSSIPAKIKSKMKLGGRLRQPMKIKVKNFLIDHQRERMHLDLLNDLRILYSSEKKKLSESNAQLQEFRERIFPKKKDDDVSDLVLFGGRQFEKKLTPDQELLLSFQRELDQRQQKMAGLLDIMSTRVDRAIAISEKNAASARLNVQHLNALTEELLRSFNHTVMEVPVHHDTVQDLHQQNVYSSVLPGPPLFVNYRNNNNAVDFEQRLKNAVTLRSKKDKYIKKAQK
jgi:hypothetical protein